ARRRTPHRYSATAATTPMVSSCHGCQSVNADATVNGGGPPSPCARIRTTWAGYARGGGPTRAAGTGPPRAAGRRAAGPDHTRLDPHPGAVARGVGAIMTA